MTDLQTATGQHLRDEDWHGDDLGSARFVDCTFTGVDLREADLSMSDLTLTSLARAQLDRAVLHGAEVDTSA